MAETAGKPAPLINKVTAFHAPLVLADKYLRQLHLNHARVAKEWQISDLSADIPVNGSLLAGNRVYGVSTPVPAAVNDKLLGLLVQFHLIDALAFEAQNMTRDADAHIPALYKVVRSLIFQQVIGGRHLFFTHRTGEEPRKFLKNIIKQ
jgi:hypothetical protein